MPRLLIAEEDVPKRYKHPDLKKRRDVLRDTVRKLATESSRLAYYKKAEKNHLRWRSIAQNTQTVRVIAGDWGDVTQALTKERGQIYAVLNMANAHSPGGGYLEGMVAQEENMFRRTTCHFHVADEEMDAEQRYYTPKETDLINGEQGLVYLDIAHPRVCIKGSEQLGVTGYQDLHEEDLFLFYELKSAADDLRGGKPFNENSMRKKIRAQLDTLCENGIRNVVFSAFGCGAFLNPAEDVARIYREELQRGAGDFDSVVFAVYQAGYGPDNFTPFHRALDGMQLTTQPPQLNTPNLTTLLQTIKINVNNAVWDHRGFAYPFFDIRKTPKGIEQIRDILMSNIGEKAQWTQLKKLAEYRLAHPPLFTKRDDNVRNLYQKISQLKVSRVNDDVIRSFELNPPLTAGRAVAYRQHFKATQHPVVTPTVR